MTAFQKAISPKRVVSRKRYGRGYDYTYACGHTVWQGIDTKMKRMVCADCVDEQAARERVVL